MSSYDVGHDIEQLRGHIMRLAGNKTEEDLANGEVRTSACRKIVAVYMRRARRARQLISDARRRRRICT